MKHSRKGRKHRGSRSGQSKAGQDENQGAVEKRNMAKAVQGKKSVRAGEVRAETNIGIEAGDNVEEKAVDKGRYGGAAGHVLSARDESIWDNKETRGNNGGTEKGGRNEGCMVKRDGGQSDKDDGDAEPNKGGMETNIDTSVRWTIREMKSKIESLRETGTKELDSKLDEWKDQIVCTERMLEDNERLRNDLARMKEEEEHMELQGQVDKVLKQSGEDRMRGVRINLREITDSVMKMKARLADLTRMDEESGEGAYEMRKKWEEAMEEKHGRDRERNRKKVMEITRMGKKLHDKEYGDLTSSEVSTLCWARMTCVSMENRIKAKYVRGKQIEEDEAYLDEALNDLKEIIRNKMTDGAYIRKEDLLEEDEVNEEELEDIGEKVDLEIEDSEERMEQAIDFYVKLGMDDETLDVKGEETRMNTGNEEELRTGTPNGVGLQKEEHGLVVETLDVKGEETRMNAGNEEELRTGTPDGVGLRKEEHGLVVEGIREFASIVEGNGNGSTNDEGMAQMEDEMKDGGGDLALSKETMRKDDGEREAIQEKDEGNENKTMRIVVDKMRKENEDLKKKNEEMLIQMQGLQRELSRAKINEERSRIKAEEWGKVYREQGEDMNKKRLELWKETNVWKEKNFISELEVKKLKRELEDLIRMQGGQERPDAGENIGNIDVHRGESVEKRNDDRRERRHREGRDDNKWMLGRNGVHRERDERRYCHYWNNGGCKYRNSECRYKHYRSPDCRDQGDCTRYKCMFRHAHAFGRDKKEIDGVRASYDRRPEVNENMRERRGYSGGQWGRGDEKDRMENNRVFNSRESVARMNDRRRIGAMGEEQRGYQGRRDMLNARGAGTNSFKGVRL